jgi:UPF0755 protein
MPSLKSGLWCAFRGLWSNISGPKSALVLILSYAYGILVFYLCISNLLGPVGSTPATEEAVWISHGMSATEIGSLLARRGFIRSAFLFRLTSVLSGTSRSLKAGEYALSTDMSAFRILRRIAAGEVILYRFTIPEGFTVSQIARLWEERGFGTAADFIEASRAPVMRERYGIASNSLEGYLFPDTYMFPHGISEQEAINEMLSQFDEKVSYLMEDTGAAHCVCTAGVTLSRHEAISLASIIEKEAKVEDEKPIISAVFHNRLGQGRKLESCATVLYSLGYPRRKLTDRDLKNTRSPYNTYIHKGLPPGPICNPGLGSIAAALNPSKHGYLYFVSKNDGTHYFAATYKEFLDAKRKYQDS